MKRTVAREKGFFVIKVLLILLISIVLGTLLLIGVFSIPTDRMYNNVKESTYIFDLEGTYPAIDKQISKKLDNYTDGLMLSEAVYNKEEVSVVEKAMAVYQPVIKDYSPDYTLSIYMSKDGDYSDGSYKRYWHGFLIILKPLLLCCNYLGIRNINRVIQMILAFLIILCLYKRKMSSMIIPFILSFLFLRPDAMGLSLQYSSIYYVTALSILAILLFREKFENRNLYPFVFLIIGICTSYFDLLTYPLVTLGLPLTVVMMYQNKSKVFDSIKKILGYSGMWGIGYAGMWCGKWFIGSILLKENLFMDAINTIKFRSSTSFEETKFTHLDVISENIIIGFWDIKALCLAVVIVILIMVLIKNYKNLRNTLLESLPFLVIMIMPFCWYILTANHSYIHARFTYRELVIAVFAFLCMGFRALQRTEKIN